MALGSISLPEIDPVEFPRTLGDKLVCTMNFGVEVSRGGQSGYEHPNIIRPDVIRRYAGQLKGHTLSNRFIDMMRFFLARRGGYGFELYDVADHASDDAGGTGVIKLMAGAYRLVKVYADPIRPFERVITHPDPDSLVLSAPGALSVERGTGKVLGATGSGTWTGEFRVPARFEPDANSVTYLPATETQVNFEWSVALSEVIMPWASPS